MAKKPDACAAVLAEMVAWARAREIDVIYGDWNQALKRRQADQHSPLEKALDPGEWLYPPQNTILCGIAARHRGHVLWLDPSQNTTLQDQAAQPWHVGH